MDVANLAARLLATDWLEKQIFISKDDVTRSNMGSFLHSMRAREEAEKICEEHSLNIALLKPLFTHLMKGHNNKHIAEQIGVHRVTVQRYVAALREMEADKFEKLYATVLSGVIDESFDSNDVEEDPALIQAGIR